MYTVEEIMDTVRPILKAHGVKKAVLFGSYAKGCADKYSDIDLFVDSGLHGFKFFGLLGDIADVFTVPVDLVDKRMVTPDGELDVEIRNTGREIVL